MNTNARWLVTDTASGAVALGLYTDEPDYAVELTGSWLGKDGAFEAGSDLRVVRATYKDLDVDDADDVLLYGRGTRLLAVDIDSDTSMDSVIIEHLAQDLAKEDLSGGLRIGGKRYDEEAVRKIAEI